MIRLLTSAILAIFLITLFVVLRTETAVAKVKPPKITWLTIEQAYALHQTQPRKILIDVYTDWCGWCKVMDRETYTDSRVIEYINEHYYPVKFNAEQREDVVLGGQKFVFMPQGNGGVHQFAASILNNNLRYPSTVFLDDTFNIIQPLPGYLKAKEFHEIITFFGGDFYKTVPFETFKSETYPQQFAGK
jgi:thioredoxin-related protein